MDFKNILEGTRPFFQGLPSPSTSTSIPPAHAHTLTSSQGNASRESPMQRDSHILNHTNSHPHNLHNHNSHPHVTHSHVHPLSLNSHHGRLSTPPSLAPLILPMTGSQDGVTTMRSKYEEGLGAALSQMYTSATGPSSSQSPLNLNLSRLGLTHPSHSHNQRVDTSSVDRISVGPGPGTTVLSVPSGTPNKVGGNTNSVNNTGSANSNMVGVSVAGVRRESPLDLSVKTVRQSADSSTSLLAIDSNANSHVMGNGSRSLSSSGASTPINPGSNNGTSGIMMNSRERDSVSSVIAAVANSTTGVPERDRDIRRERDRPNQKDRGRSRDREKTRSRENSSSSKNSRTSASTPTGLLSGIPHHHSRQQSPSSASQQQSVAAHLLHSQRAPGLNIPTPTPPPRTGSSSSGVSASYNVNQQGPQAQSPLPTPQHHPHHLFAAHYSSGVQSRATPTSAYHHPHYPPTASTQQHQQQPTSNLPPNSSSSSSIASHGSQNASSRQSAQPQVGIQTPSNQQQAQRPSSVIPPYNPPPPNLGVGLAAYHHHHHQQPQTSHHAPPPSATYSHPHQTHPGYPQYHPHFSAHAHHTPSPSQTTPTQSSGTPSTSQAGAQQHQTPYYPTYGHGLSHAIPPSSSTAPPTSAQQQQRSSSSSNAQPQQSQAQPPPSSTLAQQNPTSSSQPQSVPPPHNQYIQHTQQRPSPYAPPPQSQTSQQHPTPSQAPYYHHPTTSPATAAHYYQQAAANRTSASTAAQPNPTTGYPPYGTPPGAATAPYTHPQHHYPPTPQGINHLSAYPSYLIHQQGARPPNSTAAQPPAVASPQNYPSAQHYQSHPGLRPSTPTGPPPSTPSSTPSQSQPQALPNYSTPSQNHVQSKIPSQNSASVIANNSNSNSSNGSTGSNMKPPQNPPKSGNPKSGPSRKNLLNLLRNSLETRIHEKQEKEKFQFNHQTWNFHGRKYNTTLPPINGSSGNSGGTPPSGSHPNSPAHLSNSANGNGANSSGYSSGCSSGQSLGSNGKDPSQNVFGIGQRNSLTNYQHSKYESSSFTEANANESPQSEISNQVMTGPGSGGSSAGEASSIHRIRTKAEKKQLFPNLLSQIEQENSNKANNNLNQVYTSSSMTNINSKTLATSVFDFQDEEDEFGGNGARSSTTPVSAPGSASPKKKGSGAGTGKTKSPKKIGGEIRRGSASKKTDLTPVSTFSHLVSQTNSLDSSSNQSIKKEFSSVIPNEENSAIPSTVASDIKEVKPQTTRAVVGAAVESIDAFWAACDSFVNDLTSNPTTIKSRRGGLWQKLKVKKKPGEAGSSKNRRIKRNSSEEDSDFEVEEDEEEEEEEKSEVEDDSHSESGSESDSHRSLGSEVEGRIGKRVKSNKKLHKKKKVNQISSEDDESGSGKSETGKSGRKESKSIHSSPTGSRNGSTTVKISRSEDGKKIVKKNSRGKGGSTISSNKNEIVSNGKELGKRNKRSRSQRRRSTRKRKTVVNIGKIPGMSDLDDDEDATSRTSIGSESDLGSEDSEFDGGSIAPSFSSGDSDDNSSSDDDDSDIGLDSDDTNSDESNSNSNSDDDDSLSSSSSRPGVKRKSSGKTPGKSKSKRGRSSSSLLKSSNKRKGKGKKNKKSDSKTRKGRRVSSRRKTRAGSKNAERSKKDSGDKENESDNENDHLSADSDSGEINKKRGKKRKLRSQGQQREGGRKLRPKRNCAPIPGKGKLKDISGESEEDEAVGSSGEEWIMRGELGKKKRRIVFGDGSDFRRPGWEEELIDFKKKLRMPSKLIRVSKPSSLSMSPARTGTQSASSSVAGGPTFPHAKDDKEPVTPKTAKENKIPTPGKGSQNQGGKGDKTPEKDDRTSKDKEKRPKGRPPKNSAASPTHSNTGSNSTIPIPTSTTAVPIETPVATTPSKTKSPAKSAKGSPKVQIKLEKIKSDSEIMSEPAIEQAVQRMRAATKRDKSGGPKLPAILKLEKEEADKISDVDESGKGKSDKEIQMLPTPGPAATKFNKKMSIKSVFGVDLPMAAKKTLRRNKFKSGFDYIRKKKKAAVLTPDGSIAPPPPKRVKTAVEKNMNVEDIQVEMRGWVLNKGLGETALHRAARLGYPDVAAYCLEYDVCSPNCKDNAGYSPLHETCIKGNLEVAKVLLAYGANPSQAAPGGIRPLHEACENGHVELVRLIISYGADPLLATYAGQAPLELAENHRSVKLLLEQHINDVQGKEEKPWEFRGSGSWAEAPFDNGYDVTADPPDEEDNDVIDGFEFESSENPLPLLYKLKGESPDYILLQDLLTYVGQVRERFMKNHPTAEIVELNSNDFLEQAQCCHLLGEKFNLNSSSDLLTLVKYDDRVKKMLNIESCIIK